MTSPIAPGRINRSSCYTADTDRQSDVDGFGRKAHAVVARLVAKFPGDLDQSGLHGVCDLETREQLEASGEHRQRRRGEFDLVQLRLGINHFGGVNGPESQVRRKGIR